MTPGRAVAQPPDQVETPDGLYLSPTQLAELRRRLDRVEQLLKEAVPHG